jgi:hypothetical protein
VPFTAVQSHIIHGLDSIVRTLKARADESDRLKHERDELEDAYNLHVQLYQTVIKEKDDAVSEMRR